MAVAGMLTEDGQPDLDLSERDFERFSRIVHETSGIFLTANKKELVRARLGKVLRRRGIPSFRDYLRQLENDDSGDEVTLLLDAISTNVTSFFREADHFRFVEQVALPPIVAARHRKGEKRIRAWCAGCSSGEEPYTVAITLLEALPDSAEWDIGILATDLSTRVLSAARGGLYAADKFRDVAPQIVSRYFTPEAADGERSYYRVAPAVRRLVTFGRLNLLHEYPFKGPFDFIFCRNVMIYFDRPTQETLVNRFASYLAEGGHFFIGHSESLNAVSHPFQYVRPSVYRKGGSRPSGTGRPQ